MNKLTRYSPEVRERAVRLVSTEKIGRIRSCTLGRRGLEAEAQWIERHQQLWNARFDALDALVEQMQHKGKAYGRKK